MVHLLLLELNDDQYQVHLFHFFILWSLNYGLVPPPTIFGRTSVATSSYVRQRQVRTQPVRLIRATNPQIIIVIHDYGQYTTSRLEKTKAAHY